MRMMSQALCVHDYGYICIERCAQARFDNGNAVEQQYFREEWRVEAGHGRIKNQVLKLVACNRRRDC